MQLLEHSPSVTKWLQWLKVPLLESGDMLGIKLATRLLVTLLRQGEKAAHILIENHNLLGLLERVLFLPYEFLVETFMQVLKVILASGDDDLRKMVISRSEILLAIACLIHTSINSMQTLALEILIDLLKENSKYQLISLIEKRVLRKVNVIVGLAATTRNKEMNALWKQLDDCIVAHCDRYMELAADDDRRRIRNSKVLAAKEKVDSRQDDLRKRGNEAFVKGRYWTAIEEYTVGILVASMPASDVDSVLYSNRAECYLRLDMYEKAVLDATRSINCMFNRSSVYSKTCFRRAKAMFALGRYYEAYNDVAVCVKADPKEEKFQELYSMLDDKWKNGEFVEMVQPSFSTSDDQWKENEEKAKDWKKKQLEKEKIERDRRLMEESEELDKAQKEKEMVKFFSNKEKPMKEMKKRLKESEDRKAEDEEKEMKKRKSKVSVCAECGREATGMKKCARCSTHFCDKICQSKAWPKHKLVCK
jgi:tetratricopeptide (TPR) repeat protein